jgi:hypothetical protein
MREPGALTVVVGRFEPFAGVTGGCSSGARSVSTSTPLRGWGTFIELEAVAQPRSDLADEYALVQTLRERLGITHDRLVASGYAEQLRARVAA